MTIKSMTIKKAQLLIFNEWDLLFRVRLYSKDFRE